MKSAEKIFDVLEYVILRNGERVTPTDTAAALGLNLATATRILRVLTNRGYLVQISRKGGYIPGPMVTSVSTRKNMFTHLADAAEIPLKKLAVTLQCQVNIAVMNGDRRIMLRFHAPDYEFSPWNHFFFTDHWITATGRLLIASLEESKAREVCSACGIVPFPADELAQIRKNGFVRFPLDDLMIIGHWIRLPGFPAAAFGFGVPAERAEEAFRCSARTAEQILFNLQNRNQAY